MKVEGTLWTVFEETVKEYINTHERYDEELRKAYKLLGSAIAATDARYGDSNQQLAASVADFWFAFKEIVPSGEREQDKYNNVRSAVHQLITSLR